MNPIQNPDTSTSGAGDGIDTQYNTNIHINTKNITLVPSPHMHMVIPGSAPLLSTPTIRGGKRSYHTFALSQGTPESGGAPRSSPSQSWSQSQSQSSSSGANHKGYNTAPNPDLRSLSSNPYPHYLSQSQYQPQPQSHFQSQFRLPIQPQPQYQPQSQYQYPNPRPYPPLPPTNSTQYIIKPHQNPNPPTPIQSQPQPQFQPQPQPQPQPRPQLQSQSQPRHQPQPQLQFQPQPQLQSLSGSNSVPPHGFKAEPLPSSKSSSPINTPSDSPAESSTAPLGQHINGIIDFVRAQHVSHAREKSALRAQTGRTLVQLESDLGDARANLEKVQAQLEEEGKKRKASEEALGRVKAALENLEAVKQENAVLKEGQGALERELLALKEEQKRLLGEGQKKDEKIRWFTREWDLARALRMKLHAENEELKCAEEKIRARLYLEFEERIMQVLITTQNKLRPPRPEQKQAPTPVHDQVSAEGSDQQQPQLHTAEL